MATKHTHASITDPGIRYILARDLWVLRIAMRRIKIDMSSDWASGIMFGMDTISRRHDAWRNIGPEYLTNKYYQVRK